jgi:hypothetical protein
MQVRDLNSEQDWRSRLSDLDDIPGEMPLDKKMAWDALHSRIQSKQRSGKRAWYYAAAVVFIAISMLSFLFSNKPENAVAKEEARAATKPAVARPEAPLILNPDSPKATFNPKASRSVSDKFVAVKSLQSTTTETCDSALQNVIATIDTSNKITDSAMLATTRPPAKKKLKVVHINEIAPAPASDPDMAVRRQSKVLLFFNNPGASTPVANSGDNTGGLKIKFNSVN